jgi:DNA-binding transcriptional ArsR family regulator
MRHAVVRALRCITRMIQARFSTEALTRVRFAISPTLEAIASLGPLGGRPSCRQHGDGESAASLHGPWVEQARRLTDDLDLSVLYALQDSDTYNPDFIHPLPCGPLAEFEDDLREMLDTPLEQIRTEVRSAYRDQPLPAVLEPFLNATGAAVADLTELMRSYWDRALAVHWPRVRALLENDVLYRARQIADGGTRRLFADLDPSVSWDDGVLRIDRSHQCDDAVLDLDERGLLLIPSVFAGPRVWTVTAEPWQPTVIYPARGVGMLWDPQRPAPPDALAKLIGRSRATLLMALDCPRSTTELAGALGVSSGGISQQLAILGDAGLISRRRVQRFVLYLRSPDGDALVDAATRAA